MAKAISSWLQPEVTESESLEAAAPGSREILERPPVDCVDWIESNVIDPTTVNPLTWDFSTARFLKLEPFQKSIIRHVTRLDPKTGLFPYRTIVWSQIKKSGKTQIAGAIGAWFAAQVEAPNLVLTVANNQEQSAGRIFDAMKPSLKLLGCDVPVAKNASPVIRLSNGTIIRAIPNNYEGEAGANYGLTLWSELWAFASERGTRLFEELMPVPTRRHSMRWIETYAGFEDESDLLLSIFLKVFKSTAEIDEKGKPDLQEGARVVKSLADIKTDGHPACFEIPAEGTFVFWDHERRMPWQRGTIGDQYYGAMKKDLRPSAYVRLCENRWQKSESKFIPETWWTRSVRRAERTVDGRAMVVALDASQRHDTSSCVGVFPREFGSETYETGFVSVHDPHGRDIDIDETLAADVIGLWNQGLIIPPVWYDPYQMHQVAINLRKLGIPCEEFKQGPERTRADSFLWRLYRDGEIVNYDHPDLKEHVSKAKARELENEQVRIVKGTTSDAGKVDACVAQAMAAYKASQIEPLEEGFSILAHGSTEGWSPKG